MRNSKLFLSAVLSSLGIFLYVAGVAWVLNHAEKLFGNAGKADNFLAPMAMLLLFVFSAAATGLLFLGRPAHLYLSGFKKESFLLIIYTLACLCVSVLSIFGYLAIR